MRIVAALLTVSVMVGPALAASSTPAASPIPTSAVERGSTGEPAPAGPSTGHLADWSIGRVRRLAGTSLLAAGTLALLVALCSAVLGEMKRSSVEARRGARRRHAAGESGAALDGVAAGAAAAGVVLLGVGIFLVLTSTLPPQA